MPVTGLFSSCFALYIRRSFSAPSGNSGWYKKNTHVEFVNPDDTTSAKDAITVDRLTISFVISPFLMSYVPPFPFFAKKYDILKYTKSPDEVG